MTHRKNGCTLRDHGVIGARLSALLEENGTLLCFLSRRYSVNGREVTACRAVERALRKLRSVMENNAYREHGAEADAHHPWGDAAGAERRLHSAELLAAMFKRTYRPEEDRP